MRAISTNRQMASSSALQSFQELPRQKSTEGHVGPGVPWIWTRFGQSSSSGRSPKRVENRSGARSLHVDLDHPLGPVEVLLLAMSSNRHRGCSTRVGTFLGLLLAGHLRFEREGAQLSGGNTAGNIARITCSMSRRGNAHDNAAMESCTRRLKPSWASASRAIVAKAKLFDYIESLQSAAGTRRWAT